MTTAFAFLAFGIVLLVAFAASLWTGRTIGLYGAIETRSSIFYWIVLLTYGGLGVLSVLFALRFLSGRS
jgi:hypothetical protein